MIDKKTNKIVDFEIAMKSKQYDGNTNASSNSLERIAVERLVERWKDDTLVTHYVHDNDGVTRTAIDKSGWNAQEALDPGHACQAIERRLTAFTKANRGILQGIQAKLLRWLQYLLRTKMTQERREELWLNAWRHYIGDHSFCIHSPDSDHKAKAFHSEDLKKIKSFLEQTAHYARKVRPDIDTQANESFNKIKTIYLDKSQKYSTSGEMRICAAVCHWNRGDDWKKDLRTRLSIAPLAEEFQKLLDNERNEYAKRYIEKKTKKIEQQLHKKIQWSINHESGDYKKDGFEE